MVIPVVAWVTICDVGNQTRVGHMQDKCLIDLTSYFLYYLSGGTPSFSFYDTLDMFSYIISCIPLEKLRMM